MRLAARVQRAQRGRRSQLELTVQEAMRRILGSGREGQVLTIVSGVPTWTTPGAGGGGPATQLDADGTILDVNAIADGELLVRSGATIVSQAAGAPGAHAATHEDGGADEIDVTDLAGLLGDPQIPLPHDTTHENGGADEINVAGLSGVLADPQPPIIGPGAAQAAAGNDPRFLKRVVQELQARNTGDTAFAILRALELYLENAGGSASLRVNVVGDSYIEARQTAGAVRGYFQAERYHMGPISAAGFAWLSGGDGRVWFITGDTANMAGARMKDLVLDEEITAVDGDFVNRPTVSGTDVALVGDAPTAHSHLLADLPAALITDTELATELADYVDLTTFNDHSARHENGGADEISVAGLSGLLADAQTPIGHAPSHSAGGLDPVDVKNLAGYPGGTTQFLRADQTFAVPPAGGGGTITEVEIDFGAVAKREATINVVDAAISATDKLIVVQSGRAATGRQVDENEFERLLIVPTPKAGSMDLYITTPQQHRVLQGKWKINYQRAA